MVYYTGWLYAFGYSIWETNVTENKLSQFELFVDSTALITKCDKFGKITYANQKFLDICGWDLNEIIGKDHEIMFFIGYVAGIGESGLEHVSKV